MILRYQMVSKPKLELMQWLISVGLGSYSIDEDVECLVCTNKTSIDYVRVRYQGRVERLHRVVYSLWNNTKIPEGLLIRHTCDTALCINPKHLILGTHQDNMQDMMDRGRQHGLSGTMHGAAKLNADQVRAIRASKLSRRKLAVIYSISRNAIARVKHNKTYQEVT